MLDLGFEIPAHDVVFFASKFHVDACLRSIMVVSLSPTLRLRLRFIRAAVLLSRFGKLDHHPVRVVLLVGITRGISGRFFGYFSSGSDF